jgi:ATP-dependent RNA helicase DDX35
MAFWKPGTGRPGASSLGGAENGQEDGDDGSLFIFPSSRFGSGGGLQKQRQQLPVFKHRKALLYLAENHGTTIVLGETGSGKSTQIPQYFAEAGWAEGGRMIACTQPRRIAAQTVAARVAEEMGVPVGAEVGYCIRFEEVTTPGVTRIKYLTDGVLLREMMADPLLSSYRQDDPIFFLFSARENEKKSLVSQSLPCNVSSPSIFLMQMSGDLE